MAKPPLPPPEFANLQEYAIDALVPVALQGTETKVEPITIRIDNGQIPNVPPFAQNENYILNLLTLYAIWVDEGTEVPRKDNHIVETDERGVVQTIGADLGNFADSSTISLDVRANHLLANSTHVARFSTSEETDAGAALFRDLTGDGDLRALEVRSSGASTVAAFYIDASLGTRPAAEIKGNNPVGVGLVELNPQRSTALRIRMTSTPLVAPALDVETGGVSTPISAKHLSGENPAIRLEGFDGGAVKSSPMLLVPQAYDLAGVGAQSGSIWIRKFNDIVDHFNLKAYFGNSTRWFKHTRQAYCYARGEASGVVSSSGDKDTYTALITFSFPDDLVPDSISTVRCTVTGSVHRAIGSSSAIDQFGGLDMQLIDVTDSDEVKKTWARDLSPNGSASVAVDFTLKFDFALEAAGKRTFRIQFKKNSLEDNAHGIQVEDVFVTIETLP